MTAFFKNKATLFLKGTDHSDLFCNCLNSRICIKHTSKPSYLEFKFIKARVTQEQLWHWLLFVHECWRFYFLHPHRHQVPGESPGEDFLYIYICHTFPSMWKAGGKMLNVAFGIRTEAISSCAVTHLEQGCQTESGTAHLTEVSWSDSLDIWLVNLCVLLWLKQKPTPTKPFQKSVWHPWFRGSKVYS